MASFSSSTSAVLRFVGWSFLPSALADTVIKGYHLFLKPGIVPPQRGTPDYVKAHRIAFTALAAAYFIYTVVAAVTSLSPNYYDILGVPRNADEQLLKAAFRKFAKRNHPDRPEIGAAGAERFREVRDAYEMLKNPVKRFAYERFGPEIISWKDCTTVKEYLGRGLSASTGFPIGTAVVLGLMSILGQSSSSAFWRYAFLGTVLFAELYLILSPTVPVSSLDSSYTHSIPFLSWLLPYQQIIVLHQAFVSLSVCLSQLGPVLFPNVAQDDREVLKAVSDVIQRIAGLGGAAEHEVNRMLQSELRTLRGVRPALPSPIPSYTQATADDEATINALSAEMESLLIDARLRAHPVISTMWERVADDARDRLTSATSPISAPSGFGAAPIPQTRSSSFVRVDRGILTSPLSSPEVRASNAAGSPTLSYSRGASPVSPSFTTVNPSYGAYLRPPGADSGAGLSDTEQSEETATLIDVGRSRSTSPFVPINPSMVASHPRAASQGSAGAPPAPGDELQSATPSITPETSMPQTPRSFGKSSGAKLNQKLGSSASASGPKFFTSAFSSLKDS